MNDEITFEKLTAKLAVAAGQFLQTTITAARAQAGNGDLAAYLDVVQEIKLLLHAHGGHLRVELLAPGRDGQVVQLFAFEAESEARPCSTH